MTASRNGLALVLFLAVAAGASRAAAEEAAPGAPASWYGYQTLAADATTFALAYVGAEKNTNVALAGAVGLYFLGAPTVHALHRRPLATAGSLGMRIFLPLIAAGVAASMADCRMPVVNDENCDFGERLTGYIVGLSAAVVIDSAAIAWERRAPTEPAVPALDRSAARAASTSAGLVSLSPLALRDGAGLVLGGRF